MNKHQPRIISIVLSICMMLSLFSITLSPASAIEVPATNWVTDGNPTEPVQIEGIYQISTAGELAWFAQGSSSYYDYVLTADIDLSEHEWVRCYTSGSDSYKGTFDGAGHTISGFVLDATGYSTTSFIGVLGSSGTVKNLSIVGSVKGSGTVGGIVGWNNYGTLENVSFSGTVTGTGDNVGGLTGLNWGVVTDCSFDGSVTGSSSVGGIVGNLEGVIHNVKASGTVTSTSTLASSSVGGITGFSRGKTINAYNTATVLGKGSVGGIVGNLSSSDSAAGIVQNSYNAGAVTVDGTSTSEAGGIAGVVSDSGSILNCYNDGMVTGKSGSSIRVGGVAGDSAGTITNSFWLDSSVETGVYTGAGTHDVLSFDADGNVSGGGTLLDELNTWVNDNSALDPAPAAWSGSGGTPSFGVSNWIADGNPTPVSPISGVYRISSAEQLAWVAEQVNSGVKNFSGETVQISAPILLHAHSWVPIGTHANPFQGTFDADRQSISGMIIDGTSDNIGLFGVVGSGGTVQNLYVSGTVSGGGNVGGAVGSNAGTLINVHTFVTVNGSGSNVGGIVGTQTGGTIVNSLNANSVSGASSVGGVVGNLSGGASLQNSYNRGTVMGGNGGGVVGVNSGTITGGYYLDSSATQGVGSGSDATVSFSATDGGTLSSEVNASTVLLDVLNAEAEAYTGAKPWVADSGTLQINGGFPVLGNTLALQVLSVEGITGGTLTKTYGDDPFTPTVTITEGGSVEALIFVSTATDVAEIDEDTGEITIKKAGETDIVVTSPAVSGAYAETTISFTLKVNLAAQVLTFTTTNVGAGNFYYTSKSYGDAPFTHAATLSTGTGAITYTSSDPTVASVNEMTGEVTLHQASKDEDEDGATDGVYITATAAAVPEYYAEATESYRLTVAAAIIPKLTLPSNQTIVYDRGLAGITSDDNVTIEGAYGEQIPLTIIWYSDSANNTLATDDYVNISVGNVFSLYYRYTTTHPGYNDEPRYGSLVTFTVVEATDVNGDSATDLSDLAIIAHEDNYNKAVSDAKNPTADVNHDGKINFSDIAMVRNTRYFEK